VVTSPCRDVQMKGAPKNDAPFHFCHSPEPSTLCAQDMSTRWQRRHSHTQSLCALRRTMSTTTNLPWGTASTNPRKELPCSGELQSMIALHAHKFHSCEGAVPAADARDAAPDSPALKAPNSVWVRTIDTHVGGGTAFHPHRVRLDGRRRWAALAIVGNVVARLANLHNKRG
jgi:hypothetical protein